MSSEELTERGVIEEMKRIFHSPKPPEGIGDDCAVLRVGRERIVVSTDMLSEGTHFPSYMSSVQKGRMAAAVNLSDIAAMGGRPVAMLVSLGVPRAMKMNDVRQVAKGIHDCASRYGAEVIGGDTKSAKELTVSITVIGRKVGRLLLRSSAAPGHLVALTGSLGGAAADFIGWMRGEKPGPGSKLTNPVPRIPEGIALSRSGAAYAAIDVTDGLAMSAWYLSRASRVRLEIDENVLPVSKRLMREDIDDTLRREALLYWGGEYELLFTVKSRAALEHIASGLKTPVSIVGKVAAGRGAYLRRGASATLLEERGYDAFAGSDFAAARS